MRGSVLVLWMAATAGCGECCGDVACRVGQQCVDGECKAVEAISSDAGPPLCQPVRDDLTFVTNKGNAAADKIKISGSRNDGCTSTWTLGTNVFNDVTIDVPVAGVLFATISAGTTQIGTLENGKLGGTLDVEGETIYFASENGCYTPTDDGLVLKKTTALPVPEHCK
jgi:hypothetical protein